MESGKGKLIAVIVIVILLGIGLVPFVMYFDKWGFSKKKGVEEEFNYASSLEKMRVVAEGYYRDRLDDVAVGYKEVLTLEKMQDEYLLAEFDEECDGKSSYVEVTKTQDEEYSLFVTLTCKGKTDTLSSSFSSSDESLGEYYSKSEETILLNGKNYKMVTLFKVLEDNIGSGDEGELYYSVYKEVMIDGVAVIDEHRIGVTKLEGNISTIIKDATYEYKFLKDYKSSDEYLVLFYSDDVLEAPVILSRPRMKMIILNGEMEVLKELVHKEGDVSVWVYMDGEGYMEREIFKTEDGRVAMYYEGLTELHEDFLYNARFEGDCPNTLDEYLIKIEEGVYKEEFYMSYEGDKIGVDSETCKG